MLTNDPGFQAVSILFSDSESALSRDNVEELKERVPRLRKVVRFSSKEGKAYQVGRCRCSNPHFFFLNFFLKTINRFLLH